MSNFFVGTVVFFFCVCVHQPFHHSSILFAFVKTTNELIMQQVKCTETFCCCHFYNFTLKTIFYVPAIHSASQPVSTLRFNRTIVELLWLLPVWLAGGWRVLLLSFFFFFPTERQSHLLSSCALSRYRVRMLAGKHHISFVLVQFQTKFTYT